MYKEKTVLLKILLDLKIILLDYQNLFVRILKIVNNAAKKFYILATKSLSTLRNWLVQQNYFLICIQLKF